MSIVGPRPMVPNTFSMYSEKAKLELNKVCPGLTGIGSIVFRDEESFLSNKSAPEDFYKKHIIPYKNEIEILAIGIGHDVSRYYNRAIKITDVNELGDVMISQLNSLFEKKNKSH